MARILVVDDSALMRRLLVGVLQDAGHEVATARTGLEGLEQLNAWQPDAVTLDINMPEMDGLTALSLMMQSRPTPVIMVSSLTERGARATFEALALGAVDFVAKPGGTISLNVDAIRGQLLQKIDTALQARPARPRAAGAQGTGSPAPRRAAAATGAAARLSRASGTALGRLDGLVIVGVSTGGPRALEDVLPALPADFPWPVVVAQHMPANFTDAFARRMDGLSRISVRECNDTMPLEPGCAYIGKGGTDMVVAERLGRLVVQPRPETPGHPWHPSVDVLVDSALRLMPANRLVGVLLTGMGNDGARAMAELRKQGGRTIAESADTAVVFGMPQELIELGGATLVLPLHDVARQVVHWSRTVR